MNTKRHMRAEHDTHVKHFTAAGQRMHRGECSSCPWHGSTTSDRAKAEQEAIDHQLAVIQR